MGNVRILNYVQILLSDGLDLPVIHQELGISDMVYFFSKLYVLLSMRTLISQAPEGECTRTRAENSV